MIVFLVQKVVPSLFPSTAVSRIGAAKREVFCKSFKDEYLGAVAWQRAIGGLVDRDLRFQVVLGKFYESLSHTRCMNFERQQ